MQLRRFWQRWKVVGRAIGDMGGHVFLSLFYFTLLVPFALGLRLFSDPLDVSARSRKRGWLGRQTDVRTLDDARRQY